MAMICDTVDTDRKQRKENSTKESARNSRNRINQSKKQDSTSINGTANSDCIYNRNRCKKVVKRKQQQTNGDNLRSTSDNQKVAPTKQEQQTASKVSRQRNERKKTSLRVTVEEQQEETSPADSTSTIIEKLQIELQQTKEKLVESEERSEARRRSIAIFQSKYEEVKHNSRNVDLKNSSDVLQEDISRLQAELQTTKENLADAEVKSEARRLSVVSFQRKYIDTKNEVRHLQEQVLLAQTESKKMQTTFDLNIKEHNDRVGELKTKLEEQELTVQKEKQAHEAVTAEYGDNINKMRKQVEQHEETIRVVGEANKALKDKLQNDENILLISQLQNDSKAKDIQIQKLTAEIKRAEMLRVSSKSQDGGVKKMTRLKQELHECQEKLKLEKKKNQKLENPLQQQSRSSKAKEEELKGVDTNPSSSKKLQLADYMTSKHTLENMLVEPPTARPSPRSDLAEAINSESAPIYFTGLDEEDEIKKRQTGSTSTTENNYVENESNERLGTELAFVQNAYTADEVRVDVKRRQVVRSLILGFISSDDVIAVRLTLELPEGYLVDDTVALKVQAAIDATNTIQKCRNSKSYKLAEEAITNLETVCRWEAEGRQGDEAILSVLNVADDWLRTEWNALQAKNMGHKGGEKELKTKRATRSSGKGSQIVAICRLLIYTHHIVDSEKIRFVKQSASKLNLGGYIKVGRPGLIIMEGLEANCDSFLETIVIMRKKLRELRKGKPDSSTFASAGKITSKETICSEGNFDDGRKLPKKVIELENDVDGMTKVKKVCEIVGLLAEVEEACKR